ncbi:uncharacterized protein ISCGN_025236 [Ixodes scapularis]
MIFPEVSMATPMLSLLVLSVTSSTICTGHANLNEPVSPNKDFKAEQAPQVPASSALLKSALGAWIHDGDVNVEANPSAPNLPFRQRRVSFQVEESHPDASSKSNQTAQGSRAKHHFVIQDAADLLEPVANTSKIAPDSFLDEVIKNVPVGKPALTGGVRRAGSRNNTGNVHNISSSEKVMGDEHPMELGKVKIRPAHVVLSTNDTLQLECFVGYNTHASVSWTLNDRVLFEVDVSRIQTIDYKGVKIMASSILIRNVLKLPTFKEIYVFKCIYLFDDEMQTAQSVVHARVTDDCQTDHDCAPRNAKCANSRCACTNSLFPVKLQSVHTTCRAEAFLETECLYDEQCENVEPKSECTVHHWCACINGYARDAWSNCLPRSSGLRTRCNSDRDCIDLGASCVLSHCSCLGELQEKNGRCISRQKGSGDLLKHSLVARASQSEAYLQQPVPVLTLLVTLAPCLLARVLVRS